MGGDWLQNLTNLTANGIFSCVILILDHDIGIPFIFR